MKKITFIITIVLFIIACKKDKQQKNREFIIKRFNIHWLNLRCSDRLSYFIFFIIIIELKFIINQKHNIFIFY